MPSPSRREMASGESGMRHEHQIMVASERSDGVEPGNKGTGEHAGELKPRDVLELTGERRRRTGDVGKVQAAPPGVLVRAIHRIRAPLHPVLERLQPVDEVLIVLDDVAAAACEGARHLREPRRRYAPRLECGGEQRTAVNAGQRPHAGDAVTRAVEDGEHTVRKGEIHEPYPGHHRDVAEHEVEERRYAARLDDRGVIAQDGPCDAPRSGVDPLDLSDDARGQIGGFGQRPRYLDALLKGDCARENLGRALMVMKLVGRGDSFAGRSGLPGHGRYSIRNGNDYVTCCAAARYGRIKRLGSSRALLPPSASIDLRRHVSGHPLKQRYRAAHTSTRIAGCRTPAWWCSTPATHICGERTCGPVPSACHSRAAARAGRRRWLMEPHAHVSSSRPGGSSTRADCGWARRSSRAPART